MFFKKEEISPDLGVVQSFVRTYYPTLSLDSNMVQQLLWLQNNSVITSQSNALSKNDAVNIEVKRSLSRLYSLKLFSEGGSESYSNFVQSQAVEVGLTEGTFNRLSAFIQRLSPAAYEALMATCFITKSDQAIKSIPEGQRSVLPSDSEQFITHVVTYFPGIFPICASLRPEAISLLAFAFYKNSHARQMLDMEGGYNMTFCISEAIKTSQIRLEQYNLWFARWIINVAGLDGHVNHRGSIYLTEPVANCVLVLKSELDELWSNASHPVIDNYLAFRKSQLEVSNRYLGYLGALMRQYSPTKGREIQIWFEALNETEQQKKLEAFKAQLEQTKITPTFKPTVLVNLMQLGCSVSDALTIFTEVECQAIQIYVAAVADGRVSDNTPLSYRNVAFKEFLSPIKDYYERNHQIPELTINSGGYLSVTTDALQEESVLKRVV